MAIVPLKGQDSKGRKPPSTSRLLSKAACLLPDHLGPPPWVPAPHNSKGPHPADSLAALPLL